MARYFHTSGEAAFRELEARLTAELSSRERVVLATGGGWAARPGSIERLPGGSLVIWLRIGPEEALRRLGDSVRDRPLLAGPDPVGTLRRLAEERSGRYALAHRTVDVDGRSAAETANDIMAWLGRNIS